MRQLLIDVSVIAREDARTGIQRVVRGVWLAMNRALPPGVRLCPVVATRDRQYRHAPPDFLERKVGPERDDLAKIVVEAGDIFLALDMAAHLLPRHQRQIAGWKQRGVCVYVVIYDMLPWSNRSWFTPRTQTNFRLWLQFIQQWADRTICISSSVARDFDRWQGRWSLRRRRVESRVIQLGSDFLATAPNLGLPANAKAVLEGCCRRNTVLMVGTVEPRKGHDQAIAAFEWLRRHRADADIALIVAGRPGWKSDRLQTRMREMSAADERFVWLEDVSDEFLQLLYEKCSAVLYASRGEGLGLPLLEAAAYGKPILARDLPVFRELELPGMTYFAGDRADVLARALLTVTAGTGTRLDHGPERHLPTWSLTAVELLDAIDMRCDGSALDITDAPPAAVLCN